MTLEFWHGRAQIGLKQLVQDPKKDPSAAQDFPSADQFHVLGASDQLSVELGPTGTVLVVSGLLTRFDLFWPRGCILSQPAQTGPIPREREQHWARDDLKQHPERSHAKSGLLWGVSLQAQWVRWMAQHVRGTAFVLLLLMVLNICQFQSWALPIPVSDGYGY